MKNMKNIFLGILGMIILYSSCSPDSKALEVKDVVGDWQLKEAFRDGKKTGTLKDVYFNFKQGNAVHTNFNAEMEELETTYELKDGQLTIAGSHPLKINAERTLENELVLKTGIANAKFKLVMEPAKEEIPEKESEDMEVTTGK